MTNGIKRVTICSVAMPGDATDLNIKTICEKHGGTFVEYGPTSATCQGCAIYDVPNENYPALEDDLLAIGCTVSFNLSLKEAEEEASRTTH